MAKTFCKPVQLFFIICECAVNGGVHRGGRRICRGKRARGQMPKPTLIRAMEYL